MSDKISDALIPGLYIVATPIGNLSDITARARTVLAEADAVYAEDTRHSQHLFRSLGLGIRAFSMHQHNERGRSSEIVSRIQRGEAVALVSDAGTPLISDPGGRVVDACHDAGVDVRAVPGPSAVTAALSISGLSAEPFQFLGFLPSKKGARARMLSELADRPETLVCFEAPHRVLASLEAMRVSFGGERRATVVRELTKRFETARRDTLENLCDWVAQDENQQRGEIVLVVEGRVAAAAVEQAVSKEALLAALSAELPPRQAAALAVRLLGGEKNTWYREILSHKDQK